MADSGIVAAGFIVVNYDRREFFDPARVGLGTTPVSHLRGPGSVGDVLYGLCANSALDHLCHPLVGRWRNQRFGIVSEHSDADAPGGRPEWWWHAVCVGADPTDALRAFGDDPERFVAPRDLSAVVADYYTVVCGIEVVDGGATWRRVQHVVPDLDALTRRHHDGLPLERQVLCGGEVHTVLVWCGVGRVEQVIALDHPHPEAEAAWCALGGAVSRCAELVALYRGIDAEPDERAARHAPTP